MDSCFNFLKVDFPDLYRECTAFEEKIIHGKYDDAIVSSGRIAESITYEICLRSGNEQLSRENQYERINKLMRKNILTGKLIDYFDTIRKIRNKVVHDRNNSKYATERNANKIHKQIYI